MKQFVSPAQDRSRRTYEGLVDAARAVLRDRSYDEATLTAITERAGVTVGAFYARFASKDALLEHLEQRVYRQARAEIEAASKRSRDADLLGTIRIYVETLTELYRSERGVIRALVARSRHDPAMRERRRQFNAGLLRHGIDDLLRREEEIDHPNPREAIRIGWLFVSAALREVVLFDEYFPDHESTDGSAGQRGPIEAGATAAAHDELARAMWCYLTCRAKPSEEH